MFYVAFHCWHTIKPNKHGIDREKTEIINTSKGDPRLRLLPAYAEQARIRRFFEVGTHIFF